MFNKTYQKKNDYDIMKALSPSSIHSFLACKYKFHLEYILHLEKTNTPDPTVFGVGDCVHKLAESFTSQDIDESFIDKEKKIKYQIQRNNLDDSYVGVVIPQYEAVRDFLIKIYNDPNVKYLQQRDVKLKPKFFGKYGFNGVADLLVMYKDESALIVDYKTGKNEDEDHSLQLGIYAFGVLQLKKIQHDKIRCAILYTRTNNYKEEQYNKEKILDIMKNLKDLIMEMQELTITKKYDKCPNKFCYNCAYLDYCKTH